VVVWHGYAVLSSINFYSKGELGNVTAQAIERSKLGSVMEMPFLVATETCQKRSCGTTKSWLCYPLSSLSTFSTEPFHALGVRSVRYQL
jgi:hypothetical protein